MLNFPVAGGTSGHFLGAALAAILLGPWLACLVMAVVLGVQAFVFADGGITALGANILNMGVIGALLVGGLMHLARTARAEGDPADRRRRRLARGDGRRDGDRARARDLRHRAARHRAAGDARHAPLIGAGEAVITVAAVSAVLSTRPDLVQRAALAALAPDDAPLHDPRPRARDRARHRRLAVRVEPRPTASNASPPTRPSIERGTAQEAPVPDYAFPGVEDERLATGLAGFTGTLLVFALGFGIVDGRAEAPGRA